jgi:small subunit ribosomal protein S8
MHNHSVSDLVSRIKNGFLASKSKINAPYSKLNERILEILKSEGYILNYSRFNEGSKYFFDIHLKYYNSESVISDIFSVSKPGRRIYSPYNKISSVKNGLGTVVISTSKGLMTDYEARNNKIGGEILIKIF